MTHMKKLASLLLAMVMALALAVPAFAAGTSAVTTGTDGHTFTAYPIFTADPTDKYDGLKMETLDWHENVKGSEVYKVLNGLDAEIFPETLTIEKQVQDTNEDGSLKYEEDGTTPVMKTETVELDPASKEGAQAIAELIVKKWGDKSSRLKDTAVKELADALAEANKKANYTILGTSLDVTKNAGNQVPFGYCLIVDKVGSTETNMLWTIMEQSTKITPKKGESQVTKTVWNPNGDQDNDADWSHGEVYSDVQAGATLKEDGTVENYGDGNVKFKIKVNVPDDIDKYTTGDTSGYHITLKDQQAGGLTFKGIDSVILYSADGEIRQNIKDSQNKVTIKTEGLEEGTTFEIEIKNVQDLDNVQARDYIEIIYTAAFNENTEIGATGNSNKVSLSVNGTPAGDDEAKVYRIALDVLKTDSEGTALAGVEFELVGPNGYKATATTDAEGKLVFKGLLAGEYTLTETKPLPNYNKIDPMKVTITADAPEDSSGVPSLEVTINKEAEGDFQVVDGVVTTSIVNRQGALLPEAGGIGTTIFYILGGILVVGAAVLLITKRRMGASEE